MRSETVRVLVAQLEAHTRRGPVLVLVEDVHWVDPSTRELLDAMIGRLETLPVLAVITARPELSPPWPHYGHATVHSLNRIGRGEVKAMVDGVTGGKRLPSEVFEQILSKTDGVPLFVEELTKTVIESGLLRETAEGYLLDGPLPHLAIPSTLQDSLMARLDRLSVVKEVAQTGACIGRQFSYELLAAVVPLEERALEDALAQLIRSELIFVRGTPPEATYTFKHALLQDIAYESILHDRRRRLHHQIVTAVEALYPERIVEHAPV